MIDVKDLIEQPEKYRASQEARGEDASLAVSYTHLTLPTICSV